MKVLIDNGHGSDTPGKCSPDGRHREYLWARDVAQRLEKALTEEGIKQGKYQVCLEYHIKNCAGP